MSLVSYYSSSDDENSNVEDKKNEKADDKVGSVMSVESNNRKGQTAATSTTSNSNSTSSLFSSLPAPKSSRQCYTEETYNKTTQDVAARTSSSSSLGPIGLPSLKKRPKQPIKITAPTLEKNSDDEDDEPSLKKARPAKGLAGLFAMLPKPRKASIKETNRILIPHTLTKKPAPSKPRLKPHQPAHKSKSAGAPRGLLATTYGSEEEEEEDEDAAGKTSSFFSFGNSSTATASTHNPSNVAPPFKTVMKNVDSQKTPWSVNSLKAVQPDVDVSLKFGPSMNKVTDSQPIPENTLTAPQSDAPLNFNPSKSQDTPLAFKPSKPPVNEGHDSPLDFSKAGNPPSTHQYGYHASQYDDSHSHAAPYGYQYTEYNQPYQDQDPPAYADQQAGGQGTMPLDDQPGSSSKDLPTDKEFQRLMGKRNIGKEAINMIEITADEQTGPTQQLDWIAKKNLTEEKEYRAKLKKEQLPSMQQRKKHQITYLAHQAKERELELKNQWSLNRQTRQQTQMKYGF